MTRSDGERRRLRVAVIGAGCSGLVATKELLDEGHDVVCFERQDRIGGNFNTATGAAYEELTLTVSQYFMAFSSFPPDLSEERRFWTATEYLEYLERFVDSFGLRGKIRFGVDVRQVVREEGVGFTLEYAVDGGLETATFDAVAICQGAHRASAPRIPETVQNGSYTGEILHAAAYESPRRFAGRRVLCVGFGETAADVAEQISRVAAECWICFRRYPSVIGRGGRNGFTSDAGSTRVRHAIARDLLNRHLLQRARERLSDPNATPGEKLIASWRLESGTPAHQFLQKNDIFIPALLEGRLRFVPSDVSSLAGRTVTFASGKTIDVDAIVCCTGYEENGVPDLFDPPLSTTDVRALFKHTFHPELGARVAFIGWARPVQGGVPACSELQSRYFALLCSGARRLPETNRMKRRIEADREREESMFFEHSHIQTLCLYTQYMDDVARLVGCKPRLLRHVFDPPFFFRLLFGSNVSPQYRLRGPHSDPAAARRVIMRLPVTPRPWKNRLGQLRLATYSKLRSLVIGR